jgi:glycine/sarcosine/betaine reductase complex component A
LNGNLSLDGRDVVVLGERDGIAGPALSAVVESAGGHVVLASTECFV